MLKVMKPKTQVDNEQVLEDLEGLVSHLKGEDGKPLAGAAIAVCYIGGEIGTAWFGSSHYTLLGAVQTLSARMTEDD